MKKYLAQLRPAERRIVYGVGVALVVALNYVFIWPHFSDLHNYRTRLDNANTRLKKYQAAIAEIPDLQKKLKKYESEGEFVALEDQGVNFMSTVQMQSAQSGVQLQSFSRANTQTSDPFFVEQVQNVNVLAPEANLVDFLYKLGANPSSMIRVRDLSLQPDPPHQRLTADIRLVASYQKSPASAAKTATAKAK